MKTIRTKVFDNENDLLTSLEALKVEELSNLKKDSGIFQSRWSVVTCCPGKLCHDTPNKALPADDAIAASPVAPIAMSNKALQLTRDSLLLKELLPFSLNVNPAPQLKAGVRRKTV